MLVAVNFDYFRFRVNGVDSKTYGFPLKHSLYFLKLGPERARELAILTRKYFQRNEPAKGARLYVMFEKKGER